MVGNEVLQRDEQKRAKSTVFAAHRLKALPAQQMNKETLRQVFRFMRGDALPAQKGIEGIPLLPTQARKGFLVARRRQNLGPERGHEPGPGRVDWNFE